MVLRNLPDHESLKSLVHASPDYHSVYLSARHEVLTLVTLRDLASRDIDLSKTEAVVEICTKRYRRLSPVANVTLRKLYRHDMGIEALKTVRGNIVLGVAQCKSLLTIGSSY